MNEEIIFDFRDENFSGNVLDIGFYNYGIIYKIYKCGNEDFEIEYINGKKEEDSIKENYYDICILFLSLSSIILNVNKKTFIEDVIKYLKEDGYIYIWDIDKKRGEILNENIKILEPNEKVKEFCIKDYNVFKDNSETFVIDIISEYFDIMYAKRLNKGFCIKAHKKRRNKNESDTCRN